MEAALQVAQGAVQALARLVRDLGGRVKALDATRGKTYRRQGAALERFRGLDARAVAARLESITPMDLR